MYLIRCRQQLRNEENLVEKFKNDRQEMKDEMNRNGGIILSLVVFIGMDIFENTSSWEYIWKK